MSERAYKVSEAAEMLSVRTHSVLSLIRSGQLRAFDISLTPGGRPRWRIMADDLDAFITRRTHQAAGPRPRRKRKQRKQYF